MECPRILPKKTILSFSNKNRDFCCSYGLVVKANEWECNIIEQCNEDGVIIVSKCAGISFKSMFIIKDWGEKCIKSV